MALERVNFRWDIYNPFLPRRDLEATFYYGSSGIPWKVVLLPMNRGINYWQYALALSYDERFEPEESIVAEDIVITINVDLDAITYMVFGNVTFDAGNGFTCHYQLIDKMDSRMEPHHIFIQVSFGLPGMARENVEENGYFFNDGDLRELSHNMRRLFTSQLNPDMRIISTDGGQPDGFPVHSYIMNFRWSNLPRRDEVVVDISEYLLQKILIYMYSGDYVFSIEAEHITELFQVIYRYQLQHLYRVFVRNELWQQRVTRIPVYIESRNFPLEIVNRRPVFRAPPEWRVQHEALDAYGKCSRYDIIFKFHVGIEAGNWLSYSVQSRSPSRVHVDVSLEVVKREEGFDPKVFCFDGRDQTMEDGQSFESGPVLFLGCPETFGTSRGGEVGYSIRCFLNVNHGEMLEQLQSSRPPPPPQGEMERYHEQSEMERYNAQSEMEREYLRLEMERHNVLSDHLRMLFELRHSWRNALALIFCRLTFSGERQILDFIHMEIWKMRVPQWFNGFENASEVFQNSRCILSRFALPIVLEYIYTGKVRRSCELNYCLDEIKDFATKTNFFSLSNLLRRYEISRNR